MNEYCLNCCDTIETDNTFELCDTCLDNDEYD